MKLVSSLLTLPLRASSMLTLPLCLAALLAGCGGPNLVTLPRKAARGYLIRDVNVFTAVAGQPVMEHADVLIEGQTIKTVSRERLDGQGLTVIDGAGKTLLPGLVDSHTHVVGGMVIPWKMGQIPDLEFNLRAALYSGITTVVDMSGKSPAEMNRLAERLATGKLLGPRLYHAGMGFTGQNAHPIPYLQFVKDNLSPALHPFIPKIAIELSSEQDLDKLELHLNAKPNFTKVYLDRLPPGTGLMPDELLKKIVARSHARGLPVLLHIGTNQNLRSLLDAGADGAIHIVYKEKLDPALAKEMAAKHVFLIPTIVVWDNYHLVSINDLNHFSRLELETMKPDCRKALMKPGPVVRPPQWVAADKEVADGIPYLHANVAELKAAGVTILAGTDASNLVIALGGPLHTELQHLVKAGFTPTEALLAATSVPARVLGELLHFSPDFGTVEAGKTADLLLVSGDPTKNIADTANIEAVFRRGIKLERRPGGSMNEK